MYKHIDYRLRVCAPELANGRYASTDRDAENGWLHFSTKDAAYLEDLRAENHVVQVKSDGIWVGFSGYLPDADDPAINHADSLRDDGAEREEGLENSPPNKIDFSDQL